MKKDDLPFCPECEKDYPSGTAFCPVDGTKLLLRSEDPMIGKVFDGRYRIIFKLGEGGMGSVYKARQLNTDKLVALKVIRRSLIEDEEIVERFKREVRLQSKLEHPNIVTVIDFSRTEEGDYYFVMGFVKGTSLKKLILENKKGLALETFYTLACQICDGMDYAHEQGIIHRDLKPENICITTSKHQQIVKIMDFGLAKTVEGTATLELSKTGVLLGTPAYMSPEQAKGEVKKIGPSSDIYSLGIIFYQMLTGVLPFKSDTSWGYLVKHINEPPQPLRIVNPAIPEKIESIILLCLKKNPEERYKSVISLKQALLEAGNADRRLKPDKIVKAKIIQEDGSETIMPAPKRKSKWKIIILLLIVLIIPFLLVMRFLYFGVGFPLSSILFNDAVKKNEKFCFEMNEAINLYGEALSLFENKKYKEAEEVCLRILEMRKKLFGDEHPDIAECLHLLAMIYKKTSQYEKAEKFFKQAIAMKEKTLGMNDLQVSYSLDELGGMYYEQDWVAESKSVSITLLAKAEAAYKQALAIREKALGTEHLGIAANLTSLAEVCGREDKYEEAIGYYKRALDIRTKLLFPEHPDFMNNLETLALMYQKLNRYAEAESYLKKVLALREEVYGPDSHTVGYTLDRLAKLYDLQKQYEEAAALWERELSIWEKNTGEIHPDLAGRLLNLARIYRELKREEEAQDMEKRAELIQSKE
ncbi:MAG: tetratricopeptide repeat protein [Candidatus Aureabacteria bacterium]|nr:tetratricopeptide repeat protein [Candidatus Auribacterota bacterium]